MHRAALDPMDEVGAGDEVAPLVAAARLEGAPVLAVELEVVQPLEQLVAELGVRDALVAGEPRGDGVLLEHLVDPEVLADVAQEVQRRHPRGPVQVVHEDRGVLAGGVEERAYLLLDPRHPLRGLLLGLQPTLRRRAGVTDETGRAADEADDPVPGALEVTQDDELDEVAEVQRGCGGVEPAVRSDRPVGECLAQRGLVGGLGHQPPPLQLVEDVGHGGSFQVAGAGVAPAAPACHAGRRRWVPGARGGRRRRGRHRRRRTAGR